MHMSFGSFPTPYYTHFIISYCRNPKLEETCQRPQRCRARIQVQVLSFISSYWLKGGESPGFLGLGSNEKDAEIQKCAKIKALLRV